ncbi:MAG: hydroxyisourate hydrolase [Trebonia sp.]|jgi:5-hydroxyisourate hydrolase
MTVSTHVLDSVAGTPAPGVSVALSMRDADGSWLPVEAGVTDADGRLRFAAETTGAVYRLTFGTGLYFANRRVATFYPEVVITFSSFTLDGTPGHYHVPLLLAPYAYSTYRGS